MTHCCLCHYPGKEFYKLEPTNLPGSGFRCCDHVGCKRRVREIVSAHKALGQACDDIPSQP